ncbi:AmmeMemoRadiSam system radical SAM enzyme [uncultured Oscillibacter sp.]|uniref:AmmeMemoRadiSam system radical SAM enzyme n=1 Tax=uncultured Oscillibacter sp. TaxID=876091 RepID=UPI00261CFF0D|nr:AmmeMemoRadiSam system radical SAM enzyme [uncultured Oscillibacter sp.]
MICELCFHHCDLSEGQTSFCRARACWDGKIVPLNYGKLTSLALDPIEKKPLRRFHPGSRILSVGSFGCNLRCPFCQNHEISMCGDGELGIVELSPEALADKALELRPYGNIGIAYTYNEPLVGYEYIRDCAAQVREQGMVNALVTNGTIEEPSWRALLPIIDAANIDLKGFTSEWYRKLGGDLEMVKRSIALAAERCHVEVTTLLIPGENDSEEEIQSLAQWSAAIDPEIPLHLSRFFPRYRLTDKPPTPVERVHRLAEVAREYLALVYTGNCQ